MSIESLRAAVRDSLDDAADVAGVSSVMQWCIEWEGQRSAAVPASKTHDDERQSCGCPVDYHMADCPRITDRYDDPPEPFDPVEYE